jgi:murein DD-endopeptidase MepM/ murein hydrolase activator NlpD
MRARLLTIPIALAFVALIAPLGTLNVVGAATPKFLTLPFASPQHIHIQRGWWTPEFLGGPFTLKHHAIDYIHGTLDVTSSWENFPVVAAAAGEACAEVLGGTGCYDAPGEIMGNRVLIKHTVDGVIYYTFYNHLKSISDVIPIGSRNKTVHVKQGQVIGIAGASGNDPTFIHLHFELQNAKGKWIDPYGLYTSSRQYPDPKGKNGILSGKENYFLTNPPTVLNAKPPATPSPTPSPTPRPSHKPPATSPPPSPVGTVPPSSGVASPSSSQAAAATPDPSAAAVLPVSGLSPPAGRASESGLGLTTIVAGIVSVACFAFLAVVLLARRRSPRIGFGP